METYEFKTTFWQDFNIADNFGTKAIKDTFNKAFNEWKTDYVYLTELVLVLNWKSWQYYEKSFEIDSKNAKTYSNLYNKLYMDANDYAITHLKGKELDYYFDKVD